MHYILMPKYEHIEKPTAIHIDSIEQVYQVKILQGVHVGACVCVRVRVYKVKVR